MKKFKIYTRHEPLCPYCEGAKLLLQTEGIPYEEIVIGQDLKKEDFVEMYPDQRTVPLVFVQEDELYIKLGGYQQLREYMDSKKATQGLTL